MTALKAVNSSPRLDSARASQYHDLVLGALPHEERRAVEAQMASAPHPHYVSEYSRRLTQRWLEGKAAGEATGVARGKAEGLLAVLAARGLAVTAAERARILATTDLARLARWIARAAIAPSTTAVFGARTRARRPALAQARRRRATGG